MGVTARFSEQKAGKRYLRILGIEVDIWLWGWGFYFKGVEEGIIDRNMHDMYDTVFSGGGARFGDRPRGAKCGGFVWKWDGAVEIVGSRNMLGI